MSLSDVAGVFSRYFIIGFFLPCFFVLGALALCLSSDLLPNSYTRLDGSEQLLVVGSSSLLLGLLLMGLNWPITRLFEGYPLAHHRDTRVIGSVHDFLVCRQRRRYEKLVGIRDGKAPGRPDRAAWRLFREFPQTPDQLLPTRLGNAVLAFESHAMSLWGLDSIAAWPRIDMLLTQREAELQANSRGEAAFFVNSVLLLGAAGLVLVGDQLGNSVLHGWEQSLYLAPFLIADLLLRAAVGATVHWGNTVRAAIDLHRFDLYERLGLRRPTGFKDERDAVARRLNQAMIYGHPVPDDCFAKPPSRESGETDEE